MNVPHSFLDGTIITYTEEIGMFFTEAIIIIKTFDEFFREANHIPVIRHFFLPQLIQTH